MAKLKIITGEKNPVLRAKSAPVEKFDADLKKFVEQMEESMIGAKGLGLAASQVGKNIRVFLTTLNYKTGDEILIAMVNPEIVSRGIETEAAEEGCLSLPGIYGNVERYREITVEFFDLNGERHGLDLEGLNARVIQHETDHINGILFVDRVKEMEQKRGLIF